MNKLESDNVVLTLDATSGAFSDGINFNIITATLTNVPQNIGPVNVTFTTNSSTALFLPDNLSEITVATDEAQTVFVNLVDTVDESVTVTASLAINAEISDSTVTEFVKFQFYRLDTLRILFENNSSASNAEIFGNGNNQVAVAVSVKVLGPDASSVLSIDDVKLKSLVSLINYNTGEYLNYNGNSPESNKSWVYSDTDKGFANAYKYDNALHATETVADSDVSTVIFYVSADDLANGIDIGVSIDIPGVGEFNTTSSGTSTLNGPEGKTGSVFKSPSFIHITALQPINYGDRNNISIDQGSFQTLSTSQYYDTAFSSGGIHYPHNDGVAEMKRTILTSASGFPFIASDITYDPLTNEDASTGTSDIWGEQGMNALGDGGRPCAILGKQMNDGYYHAFFWFSLHNNIIFNGNWYSERWESGRYYSTQFAASLSEDHANDADNDGVSLLLYAFYSRENNSGYHYWDSVVRSPEVNVTDTYGNTGRFYLSFSKDTPEVVSIL